MRSWRYWYDGEQMHGQIFEVSDRDEEIDGWYRKRHEAREAYENQQQAEDVIVHGSFDALNIESLREQARSLGIAVDGRWGAARLREEIRNAE